MGDHTKHNYYTIVIIIIVGCKDAKEEPFQRTTLWNVILTYGRAENRMRSKRKDRK